MEILRENYEFGGITYLVCSNGDIFGPTGKQLKARKNADGYAVVSNALGEVFSAHLPEVQQYLQGTDA